MAFDNSARKSIQNFEDGNGDVAITYENEVITAQAAGKEDEAVYPPSSVLIENPVSIVDKNVDAHCVREVAEAFVEYLHTDEAKEIFADAGFRSTDLAEAQKGGGDFPAIEDLWDVDEFGGWDELNDKLFGDSGIATQAIAVDALSGAAQTVRIRSAPVRSKDRTVAALRHLGLRGAALIYLGRWCSCRSPRSSRRVRRRPDLVPDGARDTRRMARDPAHAASPPPSRP